MCVCSYGYLHSTSMQLHVFTHMHTTACSTWDLISKLPLVIGGSKGSANIPPHLDAVVKGHILLQKAQLLSPALVKTVRWAHRKGGVLTSMHRSKSRKLDK